MPYGLVYVIAVLALAGIVLWALKQFPEIDATIARLIRVIVIVAVCIYVLLWLLSLIPGPGFWPPVRR